MPDDVAYGFFQATTHPQLVQLCFEGRFRLAAQRVRTLAIFVGRPEGLHLCGRKVSGRGGWGGAGVV